MLDVDILLLLCEVCEEECGWGCYGLSRPTISREESKLLTNGKRVSCLSPDEIDQYGTRAVKFGYCTYYDIPEHEEELKNVMTRHST